MLPTSSSTVLSRKRVAPSALLASLVVALLGVFTIIAATPAAAHDAIISSDPADGAELTTSPAQITLTFNNDLSTLGGQILVTDAAGATVVSEAPTVTGPTAVLTLAEPLANGAYSVDWRAVSSDSHPIEGSFTFTVADPAAAVPGDPADEATVDTEAAETDAEEQPVPISATDQDTEAAAPAESTDSGSDVPWTGILIGAGLGLAVGAVLTILGKRRTRKD